MLNADPLADVPNTRRIAGVFLIGRRVDRATLDAMLADLARSNAAAKDQFNWNDMRK